MDMGAAYIITRLAKNHSILRINLENNGITDVLEEDIIETLKQNDSIIVFNIDSNKFSKSLLENISDSISCSLEKNIHTLINNNLITEDAFSLELLAGVQQLVDFI
jgi:hypothetical protein